MSHSVKATLIADQVMKIFTIALLLVFLTACASPRPWTKQEKVAAGFFLVAHSANGITTSRIDNHGNYEMNPAMGEHPSDTGVIVYFSLTGLGALTISHFYPRLRQPLLYGYGSVNTYFAIHDCRINKK